MSSDKYVYTTAQLCLAQHGDYALLYAMGKTQVLLDAGDAKGARYWNTVSDLVEDIQMSQELKGEQCH